MMRLLVIVVFSLFTIHLSASTYYVAPANATPAGNDAAAGDIQQLSICLLVLCGQFEGAGPGGDPPVEGLGVLP